MKKLFALFVVMVIVCLAAAAGEGVVWDVTAVEFKDRPSLLVTLTVPEHAYIYADRLVFEPFDNDKTPLEEIFAPQSVEKVDEFAEVPGAVVKVFPAGTYRWIFSDSVSQAGDPAIEALHCKVLYQLCTETVGDVAGQCHMPQSIDLSTGEFPAAEEAVEVLPAVEETVMTPVLPGKPWDGYEISRKAVGYMNSRQFLQFLAGGAEREDIPTGFWFMLAAALLGGLALNLTPCVLPLIPVNIAVIGSGSGKDGVIRASAYGVGMVAAYGILGSLAAVAGIPMSLLGSNWGFNIFAGVVFMVLAAALLFSKLDLSSHSGKFVKMLIHDNRAALPAVFLLGVLAAVLAGACVAPVVAAALAWTALAAGDGAWYAFAIPFALGLGMALPWPLLGAGLKIIPKPGSWMEWVKRGFALVIVLLAFWYIWLGIRISPWYGGESASDPSDPEYVLAEVADAFAAADVNGKPVLLDFTADWCKNCKAMEKKVFTDDRVQKAMAGFQFAAVDVTRNSPLFADIVEFCGIEALPGFVILEKTDKNNGE